MCFIFNTFYFYILIYINHFSSVSQLLIMSPTWFSSQALKFLSLKFPFIHVVYILCLHPLCVNLSLRLFDAKEYSHNNLMFLSINCTCVNYGSVFQFLISLLDNKHVNFILCPEYFCILYPSGLFGEIFLENK